MSQSPPVVINFSESLGSSLLSRSMSSDYQYYRKKRDVMGVLANVRNHRDMEDLYYHFNLSQDLLRELARNKVGIEHAYNVYLKHGWYWTINYIINLPLDEVGDKLISYGFSADIINDIRDGKKDKDSELNYSCKSSFYELGYRYNECNTYFGVLELLINYSNISNVIIGAYDLYAVSKLSKNIDLEVAKRYMSNLIPSSDMYTKLSSMLRDLEVHVELQLDDLGYPKLYRYRGYGMKDYVVVHFKNDNIVSVDIPKSYKSVDWNKIVKRDNEGFFYYNNYKIVHSIEQQDEFDIEVIYELYDEYDNYLLTYNATTNQAFNDNFIKSNEAAKSDNLLTLAGLKHDIGYYLLRELVRNNSPSKYRITDYIFLGDASKPNEDSVIYDTVDGRIFAVLHNRVNLDNLQNIELSQDLFFDSSLSEISLGAYRGVIKLKRMHGDRYFYVNGMKYMVPDVSISITVLVEDAIIEMDINNEDGDVVIENVKIVNSSERNFATGTYQVLYIGARD